MRVNGVIICLFLIIYHSECNYFKQARQFLRESLVEKILKAKAKNVILIIGDGMGPGTVASARIFSKGEEGLLAFEKFPTVGISKTYSNDDQTPESAATATAILTGHKVNGGTLGVLNTTYNLCGGENKGTSAKPLKTLLQYAHEAGKATGIVTTARITHATPAAAYAKSANRGWECDYNVYDADEYDEDDCPDIAYQLIHDHKYIKVLMGGGRWNFINVSTVDPEYSHKRGHRDFGDLIEDWKDDKALQGIPHEYVMSREDLLNVDTQKTEYLLGLFERTHMQYAVDNELDGFPDPTLEEMAQKAVEVLQKDPNGFFLLIEGARIDHAHHSSKARLSLLEVLELEKAVMAVDSLTADDDTLIVVTADHDHSLTAGGAAPRGAKIDGPDTGASESPDKQGMMRMILGYHNGKGYNSDFSRRDLRYEQIWLNSFRNEAIYPTSSTTHSPFDVNVYAKGPFSHLFCGVIEQHFIAHAIAYASCIGEDQFKSFCKTKAYKKWLKKTGK